MLCHKSVAGKRLVVLFNTAKKEMLRKGARLLSAVNQRLLYVVRRCELSCEHDRYVAATRRYRGAIPVRFGCVLPCCSTSRLCPRHHFTDGHGILLPCSDNPSGAARHFTNFMMHFVFHAATERWKREALVLRREVLQPQALRLCFFRSAFQNDAQKSHDTHRADKFRASPRSRTQSSVRWSMH